MSTAQLKRRAKSMIDGLSPAQLRVASEFLAFVQSRGEDATDPATRELLAIPGFAASLARGTRDVKAGRTRPWREVRRDV
jgi:hypothetical protein